MTDQSDYFSEPESTPQGGTQPEGNQTPNNETSGSNQEPNQEPTSSNQPSNPNDVFADQLTSIVNEEGNPKYDSVPKALEALKHSQQFIPELKSELEQIKQENQQLKQELEKVGTVNDVVDRITNGRQQDQGDGGNPDKDQPSGLDEQSAAQLFEQLLEQKEQQRTSEQNKQHVNQALYEKFGEKTSEQIESKAQELGTTKQELGELASRNPNMVLALFNSQPAKGPQPTTSSLNMHQYKDDSNELPVPEKSLLSGATTKDLKDHMKKIREYNYKKHGVEV